nr:1379_t:CDS:1 [Entrophospora candida]
MRPLTFYFAKDVASGGLFGNKDLAEVKPIDDCWERFWNSYPIFRHGLIIMTAGWGLGLLAITPLRVLIVYKLDSIDQDILYTNVVTYIWPAVMFLVTVLYSAILAKKMKKSLAGDGQMEAGRMEAGQTDDDQT